MSDDPLLKIYEVQAELRKIKEEMKEIQKKNDQLKNEITFKHLTETGEKVMGIYAFQLDFQSMRFNLKLMSFNRLLPLHPIEVRSVPVVSKPFPVSNCDEIFSELDENLRKINGTLNQYDTVLRQRNEVLAEQNETTQVFNTSENNLGSRSFILLIYFQGKQTILLVGGKDCMDDDGLLVLESNGQDWKELNIKLPHSIDRHGAQFLNNSLYIFGGEEEKEGTLNSTYKLLKSLQWERVADMNQRRSEISNSSVILNNQIWVCGGGNSTVEMYDPETNEWKFMK